MLKIKQIADDIGVETATVYKWIKAGLIPVFKVRGTIRVSEDDYEKFKQNAYGGLKNGTDN